MLEIDLNSFIELTKSFDIKNINSNIRFWMVRTKRGLFYEEFIKNNFIALGWNAVTKNTIIEVVNKANKNERKLKKQETIEYIRSKYPKDKRAPTTFGKCERFVSQMNCGDIVMIPSKQDTYITFAEVGKYYEDNTLTYEKEIEIIGMIESKKEYAVELKCPYKKRRHIEILKTIKGSRININLYKALNSNHSMSNIDKYSDFILSSIYPVYYWKNKINMSFNVETKKDIDAFYLSSFMYHTSNIFKFFDNDIRAFTKANLNCPGQLLLSFLVKHSDDLNQFLIMYKTPITAIWLSIIGGKFGKITIQSILDYILKIREQNSKLKSDELDRKLKEEQIEEKKLDMQSKQEDIKQKKLKNEKQSIELKKLRENCESIQTSASGLEINKKNIINFNDYHCTKDDD